MTEAQRKARRQQLAAHRKAVAALQARQGLSCSWEIGEALLTLFDALRDDLTEYSRLDDLAIRMGWLKPEPVKGGGE